MKRANWSTFCLSRIALFGIFLAATSLAHAGPFLTDTTSVAQGTTTLVEITGFPGETFAITYVDANGAKKTKTVTTVRNPVSAIGQSFSTVPAKKGTKITIKNVSQPAETTQDHVAVRFTPSNGTAVTALTMDAGSTLTAFSKAFSLGGDFTTIATTADYDPTSPAYGTLGGSIPSSSFDVFAASGGDNIGFSLDGSGLPFSLNVASTWDANLPDTGFTVPFTQMLAGRLTYLDSTTPFTGTLMGTATFLPNNVETIGGDIILDGIGTGTFSASGQTMIVPVTEPPVLVLMGIGFAGLILINATRRRKFS